MGKTSCAGRHGLQASVLALLIASALPAGAADALYTSESAFTAAVVGGLTESFESLAGTSRSLEPIVTPLFTLSTVHTPIGLQTGSNIPDTGYGAFATDGTHYVSVYLPNLPQGSITFTLARPSTAFGLAVTDIGETSGTVTLTTDVGAYAGGALLISFPHAVASGGADFIGLTQDTPFSVVTLTVTGIDEAYGVDAVRVLSAVPEPASALTLLAGMAALAALRRRR